VFTGYRPDAGTSTRSSGLWLSEALSSVSVSSSSSPSSLYLAYLLLHVVLSVSTKGSAGCTKPQILLEPYKHDKKYSPQSDPRKHSQHHNHSQQDNLTKNIY